jgi:hypothetical protein
MAVGWPTKTTYANGDVYSASDVNDTNGTINLLTTSTLSMSAGKNAVINGGADIWQRGTSIAYTGGNQYTADRWCFGSGTTGRTVSRQVTGDTTNLPFLQYCIRVQRDSGNTTTNQIKLNQSLETVNSIRFAGQTVTVSYYARAGANYSSASNLLTLDLKSGTGTDQNVDATYTGAATVATSSATLTTTWQRFTATGTVSASATEVALIFNYTPVGTAGANDYFEITGVQLELGTTATTFSRAGGTIQGELAACQRYYQKSYSTETAPQTNSSLPGIVFCASGNVINNGGPGQVPFKVEMRVAPTVTIYSYTSSTAARISDNGGTDLAANSGVANYIGTRSFYCQNATGGTINAAFNGFIFHYVASAEL